MWNTLSTVSFTVNKWIAFFILHTVHKHSFIAVLTQSFIPVLTLHFNVLFIIIRPASNTSPLPFDKDLTILKPSIFYQTDPFAVCKINVVA